MDWEFHFFVNDMRFVDWNFDGVWNWLFNDIWNLLDDFVWLRIWNFDFVFLLLNYFNWIRLVDVVFDLKEWRRR